MAPHGAPDTTSMAHLEMAQSLIETMPFRQWIPPVILSTQIIHISGGGAHTLYLDINGAVWASGLNDGGQLGDGTTTERRNPVQVVDGSGDPIIGIKEISTGEFHSVFLKTDGTVLAVGKKIAMANSGMAQLQIKK